MGMAFPQTFVPQFYQKSFLFFYLVFNIFRNAYLYISLTLNALFRRSGDFTLSLSIPLPFTLSLSLDVSLSLSIPFTSLSLSLISLSLFLSLSFSISLLSIFLSGVYNERFRPCLVTNYNRRNDKMIRFRKDKKPPKIKEIPFNFFGFTVK